MSPADELGRGLNAAAFASLLARLDPDAERAGAAYEALRRALVSFFTQRGVSTHDECADETLDRLGARLAEGLWVEDVPRFARGIARLVLLERWRRPDERKGPVAALDRAAQTPTAEPHDDALHACLERCLAGLEPGGRDLILRYYGSDGRERIESRQRIARALGVTESALRNRAQRLRDRLERCITRCLAEPAPARPGDTKG